jgi:hypothetical protein
MTRHHSPDRRQFLGQVALAGSGLGLSADPTRAEPGSVPAPGAIRSCILIFYYGGPSHLDTFDPKPEAPAEVRGEYRSGLENAFHHREHGEHREHRVNKIPIEPQRHRGTENTRSFFSVSL